MTITRVVDGNTSAATNLNQLIDLMEGAESIDFLLQSLVATDFKVRLADAAGARKFIIQDSAGVTVATIDSDGAATFTSINLSGVLIIPASASPAQTADASVVWNSAAAPAGKVLTVGDGTSRRTFQPDGKGADLAAASTINPTHRYHRVTGATGITAIGVMPAGFHLRLTFASTPQITHGTALKLAGAANYTVTAEETLEFECDGTNWREVGRKPVAAAITPGWTKVSAGSGTATSLNLSSLSGYRRYKVMLNVQGITDPITCTVNGVGGTAYKYSTLRVSSTTTFNNLYGDGVASWQFTGATDNDTSIDLLVMHRGATGGTIQGMWNAAYGPGPLFASNGGGIMTTAQSSITAIAIVWTNSLVYQYVLFGSNDIT